MKNLVTIIVPIYNSEKYLRQCLDSIVEQTYKNIEVILIDDGSSDNSKEICNEYKEKYNFIRFMQNSHNGVSHSRNTGIENSLGEYILFVDSDDYIDKNSVKTLINNILNNDVIIFNYMKFNENNIQKSDDILNIEYCKKEFLESFFEYYDNVMIHSPWNKLYRTSIIKKNKLMFNEKLELGEDLVFNLNYLEFSDNIRVINQYLYYYRYNPKSLSKKFRKDYLNIQLYLLNIVKQFLFKNNALNEKNSHNLKQSICKSIINMIQNLFLENCNLNIKNKKIILKEILDIDEIVLFKEVKIKSLQLKILRILILLKNVTLIYTYSVMKEKIKKIINRR